MRKIKEVLRLHSLGLSQRQIAASCAVGQATVSDYLKAAEAAGLKWPEIAEWSDDQVGDRRYEEYQQDYDNEDLDR